MAPLRIRNSRDSLAASAVSLVAAGIAWRLLSGGSYDQLRLAAVFLGLAVVVLSLPARWMLPATLALVASWFIAVAGARYVPDLINPPPAVGDAVGDGALLGTPYEGAQIGAVLSVALPAAVALLSLLPVWGRSGRGRLPAATASRGMAAQPTAGSRLVMWIGIAVLAFVLVPDVRSYLDAGELPLPLTSWDVSNLTAWQGFVHMGLVPMKDFFYPYGFQWLYTDGSAGPVYQWLVQVAILVIAGLALWRLTGGRTVRVLACLLVISLAGNWAETWRYVPALLIAITYAAVGPARYPRPGRDYILMFAACMVAAFVEADLLGIGLVGAVMVLLGEVVAGRVSWRSWRFVGAVALDAVPLLVAALVIVGVWLVAGMGSAELRFLGDPTGVSAEVGTNQGLGGTLSLMVFHLDYLALYAAAPALLATAGLLWARLRRRDDDDRNVAAILLAASGVCLMMVLKHFVRPIGDEVLSSAVIALAWVAILLWRRESLIRAAASAAAVVAILTMLAESGGMSLGRYVDTLTGAPNRAARSVAVAFSPERRREVQDRFDPSRFANWPEYQIASDYVNAVGRSRKPLPRFAIVGDAPLVYLLLGQRPPFLTDLDNASPIAEQNALVAGLSRESPPYVIWRRDNSVDFTPYYVRDPLVYGWMIKNYVPVRRFKSWDILRRRRLSERIPAAYWSSQLGYVGDQGLVTDLGYIPSYSAAGGSPSCSGGSGCASYGIVRATATRAAPVTFAVTGRGERFVVRLYVRPGLDSFPVRLDRLWFWPLVGAHPTLRSLTPGITVRIERLRSGDNLY